MHIAYLLDIFPKISETFVLNEILELKKSGMRISIVSLNKPTNGLTHREAQALMRSTYYVPHNGENNHAAILTALKLILRRPIRFIFTFLFVSKIHNNRSKWVFKQSLPLALKFKNLKIKHIHAHFAAQAAEYAMYISKLTGIPFSFTAHAYDIYVNPSLLREKMEKSKFVVSVCDYNTTYLQQYLPRLSPDKIHKIICGVNIKDFQPVNMTPEVSKELKIVSIGRLVEKKGYRYLIEAIHKLEFPVSCKIIGDGPEKKNLLSLIEKYQLSDNVFLLGSQNKQEIQKELSQSDVFVLPCVVAENGDRDAMPVVLKEAMAMQLPVIATDEVANPELVRPGTGFLVKPNSASELADALNQFYLLTPDQRIKMGKLGREIVVEFANIEKETEKLRRLFMGRFN